MVGQQLTINLQSKGYEVAWLSRSGKGVAGVDGFKWNIDDEFIDDAAFEGVTSIVHLAGEGIADKTMDKQAKSENS